eukprot:TRINITY_DN73636_c0_g1_i1.p1 TRINITY_DN73636_c0_g1~~TRINITY_DN73636_c0_g1_i1.p1  ORF type:complete len:205 (+),score=13.27 TRINITY_DN73636_c0_g1_i1:77-691(+)
MISMLNAMQRAKSFARGLMRSSRKVHVEEEFSSVVVSAAARDERVGCVGTRVTSLTTSGGSSGSRVGLIESCGLDWSFTEGDHDQTKLVPGMIDQAETCIDSSHLSSLQSHEMESSFDIDPQAHTMSDLSNDVSVTIRSHTTLALPEAYSTLNLMLASVPDMSSSSESDGSSAYEGSISSWISTSYAEEEERYSSSGDEDVWEA